MNADLNLANALLSICLGLIGAIWHWVRGELSQVKRDAKEAYEHANRLELQLANKHPTKDELQQAVAAYDMKMTELKVIVDNLVQTTTRLVTRLEVIVAREEMDQQRPAPKRRR
jgi:hypothetical protein